MRGVTSSSASSFDNEVDEAVRLLSKDVHTVAAETKKLDGAVGAIREGLDVLHDEMVAMTQTQHQQATTMDTHHTAHSARFAEIEKTVASLSASLSAGGGGGGSQPPSPRTLLAPLDRSPSLTNLNHLSNHQSNLGTSSRTPSPSTSRSQSPLPLPLSKATLGGIVSAGQLGSSQNHNNNNNNNNSHGTALASLHLTPSLERAHRSS